MVKPCDIGGATMVARDDFVFLSKEPKNPKNPRNHRVDSG